MIEREENLTQSSRRAEHRGHTEKRQRSESERKPESEAHAILRRRSTQLRTISATMARRAAGIAPARMTASLTMATPRKMKVPSPPAPIAAAVVAHPKGRIV